MIDSKIIDAFETISLQKMGKVRLMNRVDSKYLTTVEKICEVLRAAASEFYIQEIGGRTNMPYYTLYFDTADADMYYQHHRGKKNRQKIRIRRYEETDTAPFIEIKKKDNKGRTKKARVAMPDNVDILSCKDYLADNAAYSAECLVPHIENHFYRMTLANKAMTERITIDTNLEFHNLTTDIRVALPAIGIIEWKRDGNSEKSCMDKILKDLRIHKCGFSKYCIGLALSNTDMKQNRFKSRIRKIERLCQCAEHPEH